MRFGSARRSDMRGCGKGTKASRDYKGADRTDREILSVVRRAGTDPLSGPRLSQREVSELFQEMLRRLLAVTLRL